MFTGIVVELGRLIADPAPVAGGGVVLRVAHSPALGARLEVGASLAVAGVCLTLVESAPERSTLELSPETLARTRLGRLAAGAALNLEPALRAGEPLGGHWVQGHVDGLLTIAARQEQGAHVLMTLDLPPSFEAWVVEKGSVALDGVSLTVAARTRTTFDVALVPHTLAVTTLGAARPGQELHFEADVLAKYVTHAVAHAIERAVGPRRSGGPA